MQVEHTSGELGRPDSCFLWLINQPHHQPPKCTPWKINRWNLQISHLKRRMIFQTSMNMLHVNRALLRETTMDKAGLISFVAGVRWGGLVDQSGFYVVVQNSDWTLHKKRQQKYPKFWHLDLSGEEIYQQFPNPYRMPSMACLIIFCWYPIALIC